MIIIITVAIFCISLTIPCFLLSNFVQKNKKNIALKKINAVQYSSFVLLLAVLATYLVIVSRVPELNDMTFGDFLISLLYSVPIIFLFFGVFSSLIGAFGLLYLNAICIIILAIGDYPSIILIGLVTLIGFAVLFLILSLTAERHYHFIEKIKLLQQSTTAEELQKTFGEPTSKEEEDDGKLIITYEKTQWRGFLRGGTIVRSVKVTLVDEKVVKVTTKNMDVPVW